MSRHPLHSSARVSRTLNRLASEVVERNQGAEHLVVFGIRKRGAALANVLAQRIGEMTGRRLEAHALDVAAFRDDRPLSVPPEAPQGPDITGQDVLLVDDVLYTGRTARAALDALVRYGRPRSIQFAVLVDRGHREYPIQPDYTGHTIPTSYRARIAVEIEEDFAIYLDE